MEEAGEEEEEEEEAEEEEEKEDRGGGGGGGARRGEGRGWEEEEDSLVVLELSAQTTQPLVLQPTVDHDRSSDVSTGHHLHSNPSLCVEHLRRGQERSHVSASPELSQHHQTRLAPPPPPPPPPPPALVPLWSWKDSL